VLTIIGIFSHPDFTVGPGISPGQSHKASRGLYRRSGLVALILHHHAPKILSNNTNLALHQYAFKGRISLAQKVSPW
jgi:hypothetical protein